MSAVTAPGDDLPATDPQVLRARARTYDLLAACLDGDVDVLAGAIEDGDFARLSAALPVDLAPDFDENPDRDALAVGYDNLFVVPGPHYVPPFASAHATDPSADYESDSAYHAGDAGGELLGDPAEAVARLYTAAGFEPTRGDAIPDHVAAVFEFLAALAATEADRREAGRREDADGLRQLQRLALDRLGWLDTFHEQVREADSVEGTFARLVGVARTFAAWDARAGVGAADEPEPTAAVDSRHDSHE
ncbi:TorD/DmsD family molecular chaperone [Haloarchaeobius amylolyticus]|uniref:TorD/DmsD family molecular chaperone n=1 Tax=Haloarchaeobius amylolyticus TaxID=1198296 RepID=UPI0022706B88|nr:molecular chaperone TorD family protein [Haloarchaeobius amylolyticus]